MPRPKTNVIRVHVTVPEEVLAHMETYVTDPTKGKLRYGALSKITTALWRQFLRELEKPGINPADLLRRYGVDIGDLQE